MRLIVLLFILVTANASAQDSLNNGEIFDYDVGDIFHQYIFLQASGGNTAEKIETIITSKFYSANEDTVFYGRDRIRDFSSAGIPWGNPVYSSDTTFVTSLNSFPEGIDTIFSNSELYNGRIINQRNETTETEVNIETREWRYAEGLGETLYYFTSSTGMFSLFYIELVYFYKDETGEEWGTPLALSITDQIDGSEFRVFPNPSEGIINWDEQSNLGVPSKIVVFDLVGRVVFSKSDVISNNQIDLSDLPVGTYLLKLEFEKGYLTKRIVLQTN